MSTRFVPVLSRGWLAEELYGWRAAPTISACHAPYLYAKVMLGGNNTAANDSRRKYVAGMLAAHFGANADADLMTFVRHSQVGVDARELASKIGMLPAANARVVAYDAMSAARSESAALTTEAASHVASTLGLTAGTTSAIADLCDREAALEARRRKMMLGDETSPIA